VNSQKKVFQAAIDSNTPSFLIEYFGYGKINEKLLDFYTKDEAGLYL
jgi:hypothetical protein